MNPHQKNKVDISSLSADEQRLFRLYGKLPNKSDLLQNKLKERKYFDSGDYALSKAGKASDTGVTIIGSEHPQPGHIPHLSANSPPNNGASGSPGTEGIPNLHHRGSSSANGQSRSPIKESTSFLAQTTSIDESPLGTNDMSKPVGQAAETGDLTTKEAEPIPIRR
ncbi:putative camp-regulated phosphoprotein family protein igo1 [Phaeomoniella chlamydospora]|uniref:mRNA stability protein n=1 Tax=Phaeomoniella chlamydospora TaxID=158046 RepID=A0A0G2ESL3_PHACM|nr:putative camp-regulated phosphoprotein family protein igo1 [Phaeomoniella chlamydospora]